MKTILSDWLAALAHDNVTLWAVVFLVAAVPCGVLTWFTNKLSGAKRLLIVLPGLTTIVLFGIGLGLTTFGARTWESEVHANLVAVCGEKTADDYAHHRIRVSHTPPGVEALLRTCERARQTQTDQSTTTER
jgi:hypothetical protein